MGRKSIINDKNLVLSGDDVILYGKYYGTKWTRLPINYLKWILNTSAPEEDKAKQELERRGTILDFQNMEITPHAIDRCSQYALDVWQKKRRGEEGMYHWLHRTACNAFNVMSPRRDKSMWGKLIFVFERGKYFNTLVTVIRDRRFK